MIYINKDWQPCDRVPRVDISMPFMIQGVSGQVIIDLHTFSANSVYTEMNFKSVNDVDFKIGVLCGFKSMYQSSIHAIHIKNQNSTYRFLNHTTLCADEDYYLFVDPNRIWVFSSNYLLPSEADKLAGLEIMNVDFSHTITVRGDKHTTIHRIENSRLA